MRSQYDVYSANTGVGKHDSHTGGAEHVRPHMRFNSLSKQSWVDFV